MHIAFLLSMVVQKHECYGANSETIIDLDHDFSRNNFLFHPFKQLASHSCTLEGLFELTWHPARAANLTLYIALLPELKRNKDTVKFAIPIHRQEQLTQTSQHVDWGLSVCPTCFLRYRYKVRWPGPICSVCLSPPVLSN